MAPTPSPRTTTSSHHLLKTPHSKQRLPFPNLKNTTPHPSPSLISSIPTEHPVEVVTRIRDYPDRKDKPPSALDISADHRSIRVTSDIGYRDFGLDGVSVSESEDLEGFYKRFVESRIEGVRMGAKCTVMMYGPTGSGKSHTMFGCSKQAGIVYKALTHILGDGDGVCGGDDAGFRHGLFVQVAVLEIFNEEIYDLLSGSSSTGGTGIGIPKGTSNKVRLEVMGKKAKNATYISGNEAGKISREVAKVEKRRIVKSTLCNERSSRSHCLIILDVPSVGGRLMLVDMAGSENIEQAGQTGFEAKMQTAKINQGNTALKRVVESIANGDSHVPFRDSKLTMLLQDSFEDDKSKILMILCASPDPKELHRTISTLEYGAKAKCIVRAAHMPTPKGKMNVEDSSTLLSSQIVAMNQFIYKLQMDNKLKEKECNDAHNKLQKKEQELIELRSKLQLIEGKGAAAKEEEIDSKVAEKTHTLRLEVTKMEEMMLRQQEELLMLRKLLEEMESEKGKPEEDPLQDIDGGRLMKRLSEIYTGDQGMLESMEIDMGDQQTIHDVKEIKEDCHQHKNKWTGSVLNPNIPDVEAEANDAACIPRLPDKVCLSTVFEGDDEGEGRESLEGDEVDKEVVEDKTTYLSSKIEAVNSFLTTDTFAHKTNCCCEDLVNAEHGRDVDNLIMENAKDAASARINRIQNIFRLCGNHRELSQQVKIPTPSKRPEASNIQSSPLALRKEGGVIHDCSPLDTHSQLEVSAHNNNISDMRVNESPVSALLASFSSLHLKDDMKSSEIQSLNRYTSETSQELKENSRFGVLDEDGLMEVYVKWEASKEFSGNLIKKLKVMKNSSLLDLRKQIEIQLEEESSKQPFTFLLLGDPSGAPVSKEKEAAVRVCRLPTCNDQLNTHLACLRPIKKVVQRPDHIPFSSLENTLPSCAKFAAAF